jgi:hypothetical protein
VPSGHFITARPNGSPDQRADNPPDRLGAAGALSASERLFKAFKSFIFGLASGEVGGGVERGLGVIEVLGDLERAFCPYNRFFISRRSRASHRHPRARFGQLASRRQWL